jgi:hypothetical protein
MEIITECENYKECIKHAQRKKKKTLSSLRNAAKRVLTARLESIKHKSLPRNSLKKLFTFKTYLPQISMYLDWLNIFSHLRPLMLVLFQ